MGRPNVRGCVLGVWIVCRGARRRRLAGRDGGRRGGARPGHGALQRQRSLGLGGRRPGPRQGPEHPGRASSCATGLLVSMGNPKGHLVTTQAFRDYRLVVEYRFPGKAGNCGVLVHASTPRALYKMFPQSIEVQMHSGDAGDFWCIQEDIKVPDMEIAAPAQADREVGGRRGRRAPHPQPDGRLGEAARRVEHDGDRGARPDAEGVGQRHAGQRRLRRDRRPREDRPPGRRRPRSSSARSRSGRCPRWRGSSRDSPPPGRILRVRCRFSSISSREPQPNTMIPVFRDVRVPGVRARPGDRRAMSAAGTAANAPATPAHPVHVRVRGTIPRRVVGQPR